MNLVGQEVSGEPQDANAARAAYRSLREHLRDLGVEGEVAGVLAQLLDRHLDTLGGAWPVPAPKAWARPPDARLNPGVTQTSA